MDVRFNSALCFFERSNIIGIEPFCLEMREEALHRGIVITIASPRHADSGANLWQHVVVIVGRVLESLVAVYDQSSHVLLFFKGLGESLQHKPVVVAKAHVVGNYFV